MKKDTSNFLRDKFQDLRQRSGQYTTILKWLLTDSVWRFKGRSSRVLVSNFIGVTLQVQAIGLALYYSKMINTGDMVKLLGYEFQPRDSLTFLIIIGSGVLISFLLSASLIYYSRAAIINMARIYEEFCSKRLLSLFGTSLKVGGGPKGGFSNDSHILTYIRKDTRYCGTIFRLLLSAIVPVTTLTIAILSLLYINFPLTLIIIFLMGVSAAFQYKISIAGARSSTSMEKATQGASLAYRKIIQQQKGIAVTSISKSNWIDNLFSDGEVKRFLDAYEGHLKVVEKSIFVSDVLFAVAVSAILITMGSNIISENHDWDRLIIYLIALRYMMVNLKVSVTRLTSINRFFPQLRRYYEFLTNTRPSLKDKVNLPARYNISVSKDPINNSLPQAEIHIGSRIGLISPVELSRYTISYVTERLLAHSQKGAKHILSSMWFASSQFECTPGMITETMGFPSDVSSKDFEELIKNAGLLEEFNRHMPNLLNTQISSELWTKIDLGLRYSLALMSAIHTDSQWIILDAKGLKAIPDKARAFFLDQLADRIVVIIFIDVSAIGEYGEEMVAVINEYGVAGLGTVDWSKENAVAIMDNLNQSRIAIFGDKETADIIDDQGDNEDVV